MRIGIDVRYLSHGLVGGVHTYLANFVPELIKAASEHQIFLYADTKCPFELQELPGNVLTRYLPWRGALSSIYHDMLMRRIINADQLDVIHFPANYGLGPTNSRTIITIHDEINIMPWLKIIRGHPKKIRTMVMMSYLHILTRVSLKDANLILTVSEYSRKQISRYSGVNLQKIIPVPLAPTPDFHRIDDAAILDQIRIRYDLYKPYVLADALKNPGVLVRAWERLSASIRNEREIIFFSRHSDPPRVVHDAVNDKIARLFINPPRSDLIAFYSLADIFAFPSWIEGFGIPILEAMACGAPVIASDRGALPEVIGNAGLLVDAEDDLTLSKYLTRLLTSPQEREHFRLLGYRNVAQYSWSNAANKILESYQQVL